REAIRAGGDRIVKTTEGEPAFVAGPEMRGREDLALVADALELARGQEDDLERLRPVVSDVAGHVARPLPLDRAGPAAMDLSLRPPLAAPALDAGDGVVLLHGDLELVGRRAHGPQAGGRNRDPLGDEHPPSIGRRGASAWAFLAPRISPRIS